MIRLTRRLLTVLIAVSALALGAVPMTALAATDPSLASAGNFAVLGGTTVTNTGPSWISGLLGVFSGTAVTGFPPGTSGAQHKGDSVANTAQTDLTAAYVNAAAQECPSTNNFTGVDLSGKTLVPGVYCQTTAPTLTGTLTLNGSGIYIFQIGSTLVSGSGSKVALIGGAQPCQIFWVVASSATIHTTSQFVGNIMALTSIAMETGATLNGRALARNGAVTLDTNRIIQPAGCGYEAPALVRPPAQALAPRPAQARARRPARPLARPLARHQPRHPRSRLRAVVRRTVLPGFCCCSSVTAWRASA
jgi:hypothetical protein